MDLMSVLRLAMRALARNKMRSILTMLGIIIGVGAVIASVAVGEGASEQRHPGEEINTQLFGPITRGNTGPVA